MLLLIEDQAGRRQDVSRLPTPEHNVKLCRANSSTSPRPSLIVGNFLPHDPSH